MLLLLAAVRSYGQEHIAPVTHNPLLTARRAAAEDGAARKTTALTLPFFEDFTGYDVFPDPASWADRQVYINNTMCTDPVSRGVATFDAINEHGMPYNTVNSFAVGYADSLTSQFFDLSALTPADDVYLSFFYQPQGNGFSPETGDSLMLFFRKKHGGWQKVWAKEGTTVQPFTQVLVPVADTAYLNDSFQFRFVNIASINLNDDVWNLDYIRLDRGAAAHVVNDIAATLPPSGLLRDYTFMPYRQFLANAGGARASAHHFTVHNHYTAAQSVQYGFTAREAVSNVPLSNDNQGGSVPAQGTQQFSFPAYTATAPMQGLYDRVVFENKYYITPATPGEPHVNDTIVQEQVFDNYLAYDDGTAEKSYFLNLYPTLPGKVAIEYQLNRPDTLRGVAVYFARQVPLPFQKYFSAAVYRDIAVNGGTDELVYQQDLLEPGYRDTVNRFWIYKFDDPVPMPAGTFFISIIQPALSGSDSLYYGLDVNRTGANYLYYNVLDTWQPSGVSGALMIRPLLGQPVSGSGVAAADHRVPAVSWTIYPDPVSRAFHIAAPQYNGAVHYTLSDMTGKVLLDGTAAPGMPIDAAQLAPGMYLVRMAGQGRAVTRKIIKL